jgi:hypothetical protein
VAAGVHAGIFCLTQYPPPPLWTGSGNKIIAVCYMIPHTYRCTQRTASRLAACPFLPLPLALPAYLYLPSPFALHAAAYHAS